MPLNLPMKSACSHPPPHGILPEITSLTPPCAFLSCSLTLLHVSPGSTQYITCIPVSTTGSQELDLRSKAFILFHVLLLCDRVYIDFKIKLRSASTFSVTQGASNDMKSNAF